MAIEIVDFPIKNGGSFHGKMLVHQAGYSVTESTFVRFSLHSAEAFGVSSPTDWGVASRQDCTPGLTRDLQWDMPCQWRLIFLGCR